MPGRRHNLDNILSKKRDKLPPESLEWYGDGDKSLTTEEQDDKDPYNEDKMWMDYEEDEEANSKGADRKKIKTLSIDFKIAGTKGKRQDKS
jgi:hypothetical protein